MTSKAQTMVQFYLEQAFNPVHIPVEEAAVWASHVQKRSNLYERHLGIPLSLLGDRSVLEFGCNSGENSLVLASYGARLTFVEPNHQVLPRLKQLFTDRGLESRICALHHADIRGFASGEQFDLVIAEGFLSTLADRGPMLAKLLGLAKPFGFVIISYNDRCGGLLEMLKRAVLHRTYQLREVGDPFSDTALGLAEDLFLEDFQKLNASRTFAAWWKDTMVVPVYTDRDLWSFDEIVPILDAQGGNVHGTSPLWSTWEHCNWYKNAPAPHEVNGRFLTEWSRHLAYFATGFRPDDRFAQPLPSEGALADAGALVGLLSGVAEARLAPQSLDRSSSPLLECLGNAQDVRVRGLALELHRVLQALAGSDVDVLRSTYLQSPLLREAWGTPYHYLCIRKQPVAQQG